VRSQRVREKGLVDAGAGRNLEQTNSGPDAQMVDDAFAFRDHIKPK
jgi:hypothetical protein